ncbi:MAG: hypothetical protein KJI70_03455 [Patescibacteria group bacterium]|nr:hypothetical protein [Patescibacteria group bacterium]
MLRTFTTKVFNFFRTTKTKPSLPSLPSLPSSPSSSALLLSLPLLRIRVNGHEAIEAGARENPREYHNRRNFIKSSIPELINFMDMLKESDDEERVIHESIIAKIHAVFYEWCLLYHLPKENGLFWKTFLNILRMEGITEKDHFRYQKGSLVIN